MYGIIPQLSMAYDLTEDAKGLDRSVVNANVVGQNVVDSIRCMGSISGEDVITVLQQYAVLSGRLGLWEQ